MCVSNTKSVGKFTILYIYDGEMRCAMKKVVLFVVLFSIALTNFVFAQGDKVETVSNQLIIINKAINKLAFYEDGRLVNEFGVATGASAIATPEGNFKVIVKWECPVYYKTKSQGCAEGNPLGRRWIGINVPGTAGYTYGMHGTSAPWSIGTYASEGCVRMLNSQAIDLFEMVKMNTPVIIIRSEDSFEKIAKENDYNVREPKKENKKVVVIGETNLYYGTHETIKLGRTISDEKVKVVEEIDGWLLVEHDDEKVWIKTDNYVEGEVKIEEKYLMMVGGGLIFDNPKEDSSYAETLNSYIFKSTKSAGEWVHVDYTKGRSGWVKVESVSEATINEWSYQQDVSKGLKNIMEKSEKEKEIESIWEFIFRYII